MKQFQVLVTLAAIAAFLGGCGSETTDDSTPTNTAQNDYGHDHDDDHGHDHDDEQGHADDHDHAHDEHPLGSTTILGFEVEAAQGHGAVEPGKLCHIVIKLPYNDNGDTIVRAWIGTADRDLSYVGRGEYAASHDDYDVHAEAPDPLPENARWWIEIERPDGTVGTGSLPILTDVD